MVELTPKHIEALSYTARTYASNPDGEHYYADYNNMGLLSEILELMDMQLVERTMRSDSKDSEELESWYKLTPRGREYVDRLTRYFSDMIPGTRVVR